MATDEEWRAYLEPKIERIILDIGKIRGYLDELEQVIQTHRGRADKQWRDAVVEADDWTGWPCGYTEQWLEYFDEWLVREGE